MARSRNIKPGFFKNEVLGEMDPNMRLLFIGLWTVADREGRLEYRPRRIRMEVCPYDSFDVEESIAKLIENGFLIPYEANGIQLLQVVNWLKHQQPHHKETASVFPPPPGHSNGVCDGYIPLSNTIRNRIYARDGKVCRTCGATHGLSIDHIVPISRGGNSTNDNLQVLCMGCNFSKSNKILSTNNAQAVDASSINHAQIKQNASSPTDSLNPLTDSLNPVSPPAAEVESQAIPTTASNKKNEVPYEKIVALYHESLPELPKVAKLTKQRQGYIRQRWLEDLPDMTAWKEYFGVVRKSKFLMGKSNGSAGRPPFRADLTWLCRPENIVKVIEGKYHRG